MIKRPEYNLLKTGEQIRKLRKERNISVEQIRRYLSFESTQAIYKWENGKCFPQADNLMALAKLFEVNPAEIMIEESKYIYDDLLERILYFFELRKERDQRTVKYEYLYEYEKNSDVRGFFLIFNNSLDYFK